MIVYSSFNAFLGEPVMVTVRSYRNPIVYKAGHIIAETRIDGQMRDSDVEAAIDSFITGKVADRANADKMIPIQGQAGGLGSVPAEEIRTLLTEIRQAGQLVRVRAEAAQDTRAADQLKLKLTVRYGI